MRTGIVLMASGVLLAAQWPSMPDAAWVAFLPVCVLSTWLVPRARPLALFCCGFLWALMRAHCVMLAALPQSLEGESLVVHGRVAGLPEGDNRRLRFDFLILRTERAGASRQSDSAAEFSGRIRLAWYRDAPAIEPGQHWRLVVRLKRPRGRVNPGGFDYERWLFRHRIAATGYVVSGAGNRLDGTGAAAGLTRLRFALSRAIARRLAGREAAPVIVALAVGDRSAMTREHWRTLRATGTAHLMAISGLHVGLVAGLVYFAARRLWSMSGTAVLWLAASRAGALAALAAAVVYAGLAGFTLPTQRALVMLVAILSSIVACRHVLPTTSLALALGAVLVIDPFAVVSAGFWLSFAAVAVILWGMTGRVAGEPAAPWQRVWTRWGRVQWLVAVGLLPISIGLFLEYPLVAPLANLVAVPWASVVLVPLVVAATALVLPVPGLGGAFLEMSRWAADVLWWFLEHLAALEWVLRPAAQAQAPAVVAACVGGLLLIAPRAVPGRLVGVVWLLPLLFASGARPSAGDVRLTLLDVGQGLAAVVRTRSHVLVYDAGPRYGQGFDAGRDVLAPYLRSQGIARVDRLIISHENSDHAGGADGLREAVNTVEIVTNAPAWRGIAKPCRVGAHWVWDGVEFEILHPASDHDGRGNDGSCVLKVTGPGGRVLLTGDVEKRAEAAMVKRDRARLRAEVLVVPHHGSRSSSGAAFLDAVRPAIALFPVGYRNRYRFPHAQVLQRLSERGALPFDTARHGAITLEIDARRGIRSPRLERIASSRIWRARP